MKKLILLTLSFLLIFCYGISVWAKGEINSRKTQDFSDLYHMIHA